MAAEQNKLIDESARLLAKKEQAKAKIEAMIIRLKSLEQD